MNLGKRSSRPPRDSSSFTLLKYNQRTGQEKVEGQQRIIGVHKADRALKAALREITEKDKQDGWTWRLDPNSLVARERLGFAFAPVRN
jgi:hypothetical protein